MIRLKTIYIYYHKTINNAAVDHYKPIPNLNFIFSI